jgi:Fe-S-cluster-containing dehydrogenase component/CRP-like cAMP-binding protein
VSDNAASRPKRWDRPFGAQEMPDALIERVLQQPALAEVDPDDFPEDMALRSIIANDARYRRFSRGDVLFRQGDYGTSLFILISGSVCGYESGEQDESRLSRGRGDKKSWLGSLSQLWRNSEVPEYRSAVSAQQEADGAGRRLADRAFVVAPTYVGRNRRKNSGTVDETGIVRSSSYNGPDRRVGKSDMMVTRLEDVDAVIKEHDPFEIPAPGMFGEIAALARAPRTATIFANSDVEAVELRWQGVRDIRFWSDRFRQDIDRLYRERGVIAHLRAAPVFRKLLEGLGEKYQDAILTKIAGATEFETYGGFEWTDQFQQQRSAADGGGVHQMIEHEPVIAQEGHYVEDLLLIGRGFARLSQEVDHGEKTVGYLTTNDSFGLEEIREAHRKGESARLTHSLRAIGYVDILRVPLSIVEELVLPTLEDQIGLPQVAERFTGRESLMDFLVDNRIINGTATMVIDNNRCVNCDDCVRACASTHDGNPRFVRHGTAHLNLMVANACMHCVDPVCLIGCPTGAIHLDPDDQTKRIRIDDTTCIGCATCAQSCPYNNIRMVEVRDSSGAFIVDEKNSPIVKATKCDLCDGQLGGPACVRACPHDALMRVDMRDAVSLMDWIDQ